MIRTSLGQFEELVLLIVAALNGSGYGLNITQEINQKTNRSTRLNQIHGALQRLEDKGMVRSNMGEPTTERGGRRKRLFSITPYGSQTLGEIQTLRSHYWSIIPVHLKTTLS